MQSQNGRVYELVEDGSVVHYTTDLPSLALQLTSVPPQAHPKSFLWRQVPSLSRHPVPTPYEPL